MRLLVIGNCQARPLQMKLQRDAGFELPNPPIILHLAKADQEDEHRQMFEAADMIVAQQAYDTFAVPHLTTSALRAAYGGKVLVWPSIFFAGQTPSLHYVATPQGRVPGPLSEYHLLPLMRSFERGDSAAQAIESMNFGVNESAGEIGRQSIDTLRDREKLTDVGITDFIEEHWLESPLFFTMNHPREIVLEELYARIVRLLGRSPVEPPAGQRQTLDLIVPPVLEPDRLGAGMKFTTSEPIWGLEVVEENGRFQNGKRRMYELTELVAQFYRIYQKYGLSLGSAKLTPPAFSPKVEA